MTEEVNCEDGLEEEAVVKQPQDQPDDAATISDIVDNDMAVDDLTSDEGDKEPRLILPNLNPKEKKAKRKRQKDRFSLGLSRETSDMPLNTRFMPPRTGTKLSLRDREEKEKKKSYLDPPLSKPISHLPPLARIHRREHSNLWKETFGKDFETTDIIDIATLKKRMSTNRWKLLLEELYDDKKYLDYVKKTKKKNDDDIFTSADEGLKYLYGRADFWEQRLPIPERPPSSLKRMFSRHNENGKPTSASLSRSVTSVSASKRALPRTPSTQLSRMQKRNAMIKKSKKDETTSKKKTSPTKKPSSSKDSKLQFHGISSIGSSATSSRAPKWETSNDPAQEVTIPYAQMTVSPIRGSPELDPEDSGATENGLGDTTKDEQAPRPAPITREVTKSDIKLEEFVLDDDFNHQVFGYDEGAEEEEKV